MERPIRIFSDLSIERLGDESTAQLEKFKSGDVNLNIFLRRKARKHQQELLAVTYLLYLKDEIVGYYTLSADTMQASDDEREKYAKGKRYSRYPSVKIGRLAISKEYEGCGYGRFLIDSIKYQYANEPQAVGCRYLLVDAYKNVLKFYERNDFGYWTEEDAGDEYDTRLMFYDLTRSKIR